MTRTAEMADVVLPASVSACESEGTVTNSERRVQRVRKALDPPGDAHDDMAIIQELYQPDLAMLPIGDIFTMGPLEAAYACRLLKPKAVIPMHYGTFPMLTGTPEEFGRKLKESGSTVELITMKPGEAIS